MNGPETRIHGNSVKCYACNKLPIGYMQTGEPIHQYYTCQKHYDRNVGALDDPAWSWVPLTGTANKAEVAPVVQELAQHPDLQAAFEAFKRGE